MSVHKPNTIAAKRLGSVFETLVDLALPVADNIDQGYFYEADMVSNGMPIGKYRVIIQRVQKP